MVCPKCDEEMFGREYEPGHPQRYDGVSEWVCPKGHYRIGRWCGLELGPDEVEPRFCVARTTGATPHSGHGTLR